MSNYSSRTRGEMIMTSQWSEFLADLSKSHQGRPVAIEKGSSLPLANLPEEKAPFQGIEYQPNLKPKRIVFTIGQGSAVETFTIEDPSLVWRGRNEHGDLIGIKISDAKGRSVFLHFE